MAGPADRDELLRALRQKLAERRPHPRDGARHNTNLDLAAEAKPSVTLQARRDAALRLPPYGDGPADPLGELAGLRPPKAFKCLGAEFGPGGRVRPCCRDAA